jgi:hypothetical protein
MGYDVTQLEGADSEVARYTFENMADIQGISGFAGVSLFRSDFVESRWLDSPIGPDWLWVETRAGNLVVVADFSGRGEWKL